MSAAPYAVVALALAECGSHPDYASTGVRAVASYWLPQWREGWVCIADAEGGEWRVNLHSPDDVLAVYDCLLIN